MKFTYTLFMLVLSLIFEIGRVSGNVNLIVPNTSQDTQFPKEPQGNENESKFQKNKRSTSNYFYEIPPTLPPYQRHESEDLQNDNRRYSRRDYGESVQYSQINEFQGTQPQEHLDHGTVYHDDTKYLERKRYQEFQKYLDAVRYWDKSKYIRFLENEINDLNNLKNEEHRVSEMYPESQRHGDNGGYIENNALREKLVYRNYQRYPGSKYYLNNHPNLEKGLPGYYLKKWNEQQKLHNLEGAHVSNEYYDHDEVEDQYGNYDEPDIPTPESIDLTTPKPVKIASEPMIHHIMKNVRRGFHGMGTFYLESLHKLKRAMTWESKPRLAVYYSYPESRMD